MNPIDHPHGVVKVKLPGRPYLHQMLDSKGYPTVRRIISYNRTRRKAKELKVELTHKFYYYEIYLKS